MRISLGKCFPRVPGERSTINKLVCTEPYQIFIATGTNRISGAGCELRLISAIPVPNKVNK